MVSHPSCSTHLYAKRDPFSVVFDPARRTIMIVDHPSVPGARNRRTDQSIPTVHACTTYTTTTSFYVYTTGKRLRYGIISLFAALFFFRFSTGPARFFFHPRHISAHELRSSRGRTTTFPVASRDSIIMILSRSSRSNVLYRVDRIEIIRFVVVSHRCSRGNVSDRNVIIIVRGLLPACTEPGTATVVTPCDVSIETSPLRPTRVLD